MTPDHWVSMKSGVAPIGARYRPTISTSKPTIFPDESRYVNGTYAASQPTRRIPFFLICSMVTGAADVARDHNDTAPTAAPPRSKCSIFRRPGENANMRCLQCEL